MQNQFPNQIPNFNTPPPHQRQNTLPTFPAPIPPPNQFQLQTRPNPPPTLKLSELLKIIEQNQLEELHGLQSFLSNIDRTNAQDSSRANYYIARTTIDFVQQLILQGKTKIQTLRLLQSIQMANER